MIYNIDKIRIEAFSYRSRVCDNMILIALDNHTLSQEFSSRGLIPSQKEASLFSTRGLILFHSFLVGNVLRNSASFFPLDVNECASNPCKNGATCVNTVEGFNCTCTKGFQGKICDNGRSCNCVAD